MTPLERQGILVLQPDRAVARAQHHHKVASQTRLGVNDTDEVIWLYVNRHQYEWSNTETRVWTNLLLVHISSLVASPPVPKRDAVA